MLANWQWQRGKQKQARLAHIQSMKSQGALDWRGLTALPQTMDKTGIQLQITGHLETQRYWLLDNRTLQGRPGFDVLAAFYPNESPEALLINFGWVAQGVSRQVLPTIHLPNEQLTLTVQLKAGDLTSFHLPGASQVEPGWPKLIQYIDVAELQLQSGLQLVPFMAYTTEASGTAPSFAQPHYRPVVMPPEKHRAYALQWLLIGAAALGVFVFAIRQRLVGAPPQVKSQ